MTASFSGASVLIVNPAFKSNRFLFDADPSPTERAGDVPGTLRGRTAAFDPTRWSVVLLAAQSQSNDDARRAMNFFCRAYWPPLYSFLRRSGHAASDAQDLVQGFFAHLQEYDTLHRADPEKGRMRTFLIGALRHFLSNERARARTLKRGGGQPLISLDDSLAQAETFLATSGAEEPSVVYDRNWASTVVSHAWERLRAGYAAEGKERWLAEVKPLLFGDSTSALSQEQLSTRFGQSVSTLRVALFRLRQRYRQSLREEIAQLVSDSAEIDEEMHYLLQVLIS